MSNHPLSELARRIRRCKKCVRPKGSYPVFAEVFGAKIMLIGQAPGIEETRKGIPFIGKSGRRLFQWLSPAGIREAEFRKRVYITQVVKCFFGKGKKGDLKPTKTIISQCLPYLKEEIKKLDPDVLIPVGSLAIENILGKGQLENFVGEKFVVKILSRRRLVIPLPHPSGASVWVNKKENLPRIKKAIKIIKSLFSPQSLG